MKFRLASILSAALFSAGMAQAATELVIATVNNGHMIEMQKLSKNFEQANPDNQREQREQEQALKGHQEMANCHHNCARQQSGAAAQPAVGDQAAGDRGQVD